MPIILKVINKKNHTSYELLLCVPVKNTDIVYSERFKFVAKLSDVYFRREIAVAAIGWLPTA